MLKTARVPTIRENQGIFFSSGKSGNIIIFYFILNAGWGCKYWGQGKAASYQCLPFSALGYRTTNSKVGVIPEEVLADYIFQGLQVSFSMEWLTGCLYRQYLVRIEMSQEPI